MRPSTTLPLWPGCLWACRVSPPPPLPSCLQSANARFARSGDAAVRGREGHRPREAAGRGTRRTRLWTGRVFAGAEERLRGGWHGAEDALAHSTPNHPSAVFVNDLARDMISVPLCSTLEKEVRAAHGGFCLRSARLWLARRPAVRCVPFARSAPRGRRATRRRALSASRFAHRVRVCFALLRARRCAPRLAAGLAGWPAALRCRACASVPPSPRAALSAHLLLLTSRSSRLAARRTAHPSAAPASFSLSSIPPDQPSMLEARMAQASTVRAACCAHEGEAHAAKGRLLTSPSLSPSPALSTHPLAHYLARSRSPSLVRVCAHSSRRCSTVRGPASLSSRRAAYPFPPAVKDLITDANFDCNEDGIVRLPFPSSSPSPHSHLSLRTQRMQAMDNSHVALSSIELRREGFEPYRCDRPMSIGISLAALTKIVRSADNNDTLTMRKADDGDSLGLMFESTSESEGTRRGLSDCAMSRSCASVLAVALCERRARKWRASVCCWPGLRVARAARQA